MELRPATQGAEKFIEKMKYLSQFMGTEFEIVQSENNCKFILNQLKPPLKLVEPYDAYIDVGRIGKILGQLNWSRVWVM